MLKAFLFHARYIINELDISCSLLEKRYLGCRSGLNISMKNTGIFFNFAGNDIGCHSELLSQKICIIGCHEKSGFFFSENLSV